MSPLYFLSGGIGAFGILFLAVLCRHFYKKSQIETTFQVQCSSGDSEVMTFNYNFKEGEGKELRQGKIDEAFEYIQNRRDENHAKWLEIRAKEISENESLTSEGLKKKVEDAQKLTVAH